MSYTTSVFHSLPVLLLLLLSACASSVFTPYTERAQSYRQDLNNKQLSRSLKAIESQGFSLDSQLNLLEHGRLAQLDGQIDTSIKDFNAVINMAAKEENKARISLSNTAQSSLALVSNDNSRRYRLSIYEQVLLHQYQAFNYLLKGDLSAAGVEIRRAHYVQKHALKTISYKESLSHQQTQQLIDQQGVAQVKNSFENAYSYFFSALIYQAIGEFNNAYIDYKQALRLAPHNPFIQQALLNLAKQLGFSKDYRALKRRFPKIASKQGGSARLVVLYEQNLVPVKVSTGLSYFSRHGAVPITVPAYPKTWYPASHLQISIQQQGRVKYLGQTAMLSDVHAIAVKALQEQLPGIIWRTGLQAVSKYQLQKKASQESLGLGIGLQLYNLLSAGADVRSWSTLPGNAQVFSQQMAAGSYQLQLNSQRQQHAIALTLTAGKTTLVRVTEPGSHFYIQTVNL